MIASERWQRLLFAHVGGKSKSKLDSEQSGGFRDALRDLVSSRVQDKVHTLTQQSTLTAGCLRVLRHVHAIQLVSKRRLLRIFELTGDSFFPQFRKGNQSRSELNLWVLYIDIFYSFQAEEGRGGIQAMAAEAIRSSDSRQCTSIRWWTVWRRLSGFKLCCRHGSI